MLICYVVLLAYVPAEVIQFKRFVLARFYGLVVMSLLRSYNSNGLFLPGFTAL
jgi:hypothetical protein